MNVLVTGGAGLVGMALRKTLAQRGHKVVAIDVTDFGRGDAELYLVPLGDAARIEALARQEGVNAIIHCGAISGPMLARGEPLRMVEVNIDGSAMLLDLARRLDMQRFVLCSSISVYGDVGPGLISETTPLAPTSVYAASKIAVEALVEAFAVEYGLSGVSLRISRVYGPYRRGNCHLGGLLRDAVAGRTTQIPCEPDFLYHFVHVDDVAEAMATALEASALKHRVYNVDAAEPMTMEQIAALARSVVPGAAIELVPGADDVPDVQMGFDISRIKEDLGWAPRLPMQRGLMSYLEAIQSGQAAE